MNWNTLAVSAKNKAEMLPDVCPCYVCLCVSMSAMAVWVRRKERKECSYMSERVCVSEWRKAAPCTCLFV